MKSIFAGLDWASRTHAVCVIDERGAVCKQWEVAHDADGLRELLLQLRALRVLRIAIERPSGLLVDACLTLADGHAERMVVPDHAFQAPHADHAGLETLNQTGGGRYRSVSIITRDPTDFNPCHDKTQKRKRPVRCLRNRRAGRASRTVRT